MEACWCHSLAAGHSPSAAALPSASLCGDLGVPAIEAALRLSGTDLSTRQRTRLKNFLETESWLLVRPLGLARTAKVLRRFLLVIHCFLPSPAGYDTQTIAREPSFLAFSSLRAKSAQDYPRRQTFLPCRLTTRRCGRKILRNLPPRGRACCLACKPNLDNAYNHPNDCIPGR